MDFGTAIRAARIRKGMKQQDVAASLGVSKGLVCDYERGFKTNPSLQTLRTYAALLDLDLGDFAAEDVHGAHLDG